MSPRPKVTAFSVTDGRRHLGEVCRLDNGQHRAEDASGKRLGVFDDIAAARRAVWLAAGGVEGVAP